MKCATLAYVPPPNIGYPKVFLDNVRKFNTVHPVILYSDHEWPGMNFQVASPDKVRHPKVPWAVNNCCFFFALKIAIELKLDYFCYLEADCRVNGKNWDRNVLEITHVAAAGSPVFYHMAAAGRDGLVNATHFAGDCLEQTGRPVPWYGGPPGINARPCAYPNGAGGVYETQALAELFHGFDVDIGRFAQRCTAWDMELGFRLWDKHGASVFEHIDFLPAVFSCYGDSIHSFEERTGALTRGDVSIIHQVKNDWTV